MEWLDAGWNYFILWSLNWICHAELLRTECLLGVNETCYGDLENCNSPSNSTVIHVAELSINQVTEDTPAHGDWPHVS